MLTIEKLNSKHWNIYHCMENGNYPRLIGHISGNDKFYNAEYTQHGGTKLGYFDTVSNAMKAIDHEFNRPLNIEECEAWNNS